MTDREVMQMALEAQRAAAMWLALTTKAAGLNPHECEIELSDFPDGREPERATIASTLDAIEAASCALREALEQPPVEPNFDDPDVQAVYAILCDTDDQIPEGWHWEGFMAQRIVDEVFRVSPHRKHPNEVEVEALAQPQQEPVAWVWPTDRELSPEDAFSWVRTAHHTMPIYTAPPRREWQGLTEEEILDMAESCTAQYHDLLASPAPSRPA